MASFCHDQYEHPLLWCDEKRRLVQTRVARDGLEEVKKRKEDIKIKKIIDRNEYRDMIIKHCPWGRPGGGAPNEHIRRGNILQEGLFPESYSDCRKYTAPAYRTTRIRGGGGAPLRSASGRILTSIRDDPIISFNDSNRHHVDIDLRYKTSRKAKMDYKMQLDKIVAEKENLKRKTSIEQPKHDPWGKAGPGGMPWRNPRNVGHCFMKSMGWTDKHLLQALDTEQTKPALKEIKEVKEVNEIKETKEIREPKPVEVKQEHLEKSEKHEKSTKPSLYTPCCCVNCCCNCGLSFHDKKKSSEKIKHKPDIFDGSTTHPEVKQSEIRPQDSKVGEPAKPTKKKKQPKNGPKTRMCMITGGVELVPLLAKRRALQRPISLATTDVTKYPNVNNQQERGHLNELCRQMSQKEYRRQMDKAMEMESSRKHFEALDSIWGRPGHGAPRNIKYKQNLNNLLYRAPIKAQYVQNL